MTRSTFKSAHFLSLALPLLCVVAPALAVEPLPPRQELDAVPAEVTFDSVRFQEVLRTGKNLGSLASANSSLDDDAIQFGFAAQSEEARFFISGALFSEALAHQRGDQSAEVVRKLKALEREFIAIGVPGSLYNYVTKLRSMVESGAYESDAILQFFSLFQPFVEDLARSQSEDKLLLFRAGSWLVDMGLAAATGNMELLAQAERLAYLAREMERMEAPKGALDALREIAEISGQEEISERDAERVLTLVQRMKSLLG